MKLLITGALGHIGSRLIHGIKSGEFDEVVLLDNLAAQRYPSLFDLPYGVRFRFVDADVCSTEFRRHLYDIDILVHLAAVTDAEGSLEIPEQVERINLEGTNNVARACLSTGTKMIFLSTTSVYGVQDGEVDEDCPADLLQPQSPYAASKLKSEHFLQQLGDTKQLDFVICRFGTIFGTSIGMRFHTVVNKFCWQATMGQPVSVWRTALNQMRPYLDLSDAISALKFIINHNVFNREIYNVVTTNTSVRNIVDTIGNYVPDLAIEYVDSKIMNQLSYFVKNDKFSDLGFEFHGNLDTAIHDTLVLLQGIKQSALSYSDPVGHQCP